jgi:H+-transporting ATPase
MNIQPNLKKKENSSNHAEAATDQPEYSKIPIDQLEAKLNVTADGLKDEEAKRRLSQYGYNEISEAKTNPYLKFLSYFWGPIPWMIEVAAILSVLVHHWTDLVIIMVLLLMNSVVGFWEEYQAGNAIAALKKKLAIQAKVKRDGQWVMIPARELVPGDTIHCRMGDIVPADMRIVEDVQISVDQSALTGESLPVTHAQGDAVFSGSIIKQGEANGLVYATGTSSYFGKTAELVESTATQSHFQKAVLKIGDYLIVLAVALVILILGVALFRGDEMVTTLQFALILMVAAIPVAMPTVLSVTMAVGARILAQKEAIVTKLATIEEMAGIDILCSDKTGTLTQNKLTLGDPFCMSGVNEKSLIFYAALASKVEDQDPIDQAIFSKLDKGSTWGEYQVTNFQPFDPVSKRTEAEVKAPGDKLIKVSKGAPQMILALAQNAADIKPKVDDVVGEFAKRGFRSLGVAKAETDQKWEFLGVLPLYDPPREDSKETIKTAESMGIQVKMVTGDQVAIAKETARQLDLNPNILDAEVLTNLQHHQLAQVEETIEQTGGFAQVFPEHKYYIVDVLQRKNHIVGMTGDGVNDAPALKKADAGIAVAGATDAARAAADIVLLTPGLSVIITAIKEARKIFRRMNSYAIYRIAETIRILLFMTFSILVFNFYPVTALMIVLLALLNDGAILSIAYDRVHYADQPEKWEMRNVLGIATILGFVGVIATFGLFYLVERVFKLTPEMAQTLMYLKLSVAGHLTIFVTRTKGPFWSIKPSRILLGAVLGTQLFATLISVYGIFMYPIGWGWALLVWGYALGWFLINDRVKLAAYKLLEPRK